MPVIMNWYNEEKTIYHAQYIGDWTWDELYAALDNANREFDSVNHVVDVIQDWTKCGKLPPNIISQSRRLIDRQHPRSGINVMVGGNMLFMSLWQVFNQLYTITTRKKVFIFVDSLEKAVEVIQRERVSGGA